MAYFFYIGEYFKDDGVDLTKRWQEMKKDLINQFGNPSPPAKELKRWTYSLTAYVSGVPRGVYFLYNEDAAFFKLKYSKAEQREGGFGK